MPRYTDPDTNKSIFSETPLSEAEITEGLQLAKTPIPTSPTPSAGSRGWLGNLGKKVEIGMGGVNVGAANLAGMPVDIINKLFSIGLPISQEPIGGSEWIKKTLMTPPPKPEGLIEKTIGATGEQIPNAMLTFLTGGGAPLAAKLISAGKFAGGAGIGSGIARTVAPENPWADLAGQLAGGMGGPLVGTLRKKIGEKVIAPIIGSRALTGTETETILRAAKGTKGFRAGMRGKVNPESVYDEAQSALDRMLETRRMEYKAKLPELQQSNVNIDIRPLEKELYDRLSAFGVKFDNNRKIIRSTLDRSTLKDAERVIDMIEDWGMQIGDTTPTGLDMLKRNLDSFYSPNKNITAFIAPLRNKVKELIIKEVPGYGEQMQKYEQWSELIRDVRQNLSMGEKSSVESGIRKLMSSIRDDNEFRRSLIQELEKMGQGDLLDKIAGLRMRGIVPLQHGGTQLVGGEIISSIITGNPKILIGLPFASPRLMGETLNALGRTWNLYKSVIPMRNQTLKNVLFPSAANVFTQGQRIGMTQE